MAGDPAKELGDRVGGRGEAVGAWGPRTGKVNQENGQWVQKGERSWLTREGGVGEADLLIRLGKEIANGKQWEQGMSVKDWLDLGGWEQLEDRRAGEQGSEQRPRWGLTGPENWDEKNWSGDFFA